MGASNYSSLASTFGLVNISPLGEALSNTIISYHFLTSAVSTFITHSWGWYCSLREGEVLHKSEAQLLITASTAVTSLMSTGSAIRSCRCPCKRKESQQQDGEIRHRRNYDRNAVKENWNSLVLHQPVVVNESCTRAELISMASRRNVSPNGIPLFNIQGSLILPR